MAGRWLVGVVAFCLLGLLGCSRYVVDHPPQRTPTGSPPVRTEPAFELGDDAHPVLVHDCATSAGYEVGAWRPTPLPSAGQAEAHVIAVYETDNRHAHGYHPGAAADVYVHRVGAPIALVFSSYEPVLWRIHADQGVQLARVVLYGYHSQEVEGVPVDVPVIDRVGKARRLGHRVGYAPPPAYVEQEAGAPVVSVTGCYHASVFTLA